MSKTVTIVPPRSPIVPMTEYGNQVAARISSERKREASLLTRALLELYNDPEARKLYHDPETVTGEVVEEPVVVEEEGPKPAKEPLAPIDLSEPVDCLHCGKSFVRRVAKQKHCSSTCQERYKQAQMRLRRKEARESVTRVCAICTGSFTPDPSNIDKQKYCSPPCKKEGQRLANARLYAKRLAANQEATP